MRLRKYRNRQGETREELVLDTRQEQETWFRSCIGRVMTNTREVLDGLDAAPEFKVNWESYRKNRVKKGLKPKHL